MGRYSASPRDFEPLPLLPLSLNYPLVGALADPLGNSPAEYKAMLAKDIAIWAEAVDVAGLKQNDGIGSMGGEPVLIAGAGPVGVVTALALAQRGIPVRVFEAAEQVSFAGQTVTPARGDLALVAMV
jgi:hypothetical protein